MPVYVSVVPGRSTSSGGSFFSRPPRNGRLKTIWTVVNTARRAYDAAEDIADNSDDSLEQQIQRLYSHIGDARTGRVPLGGKEPAHAIDTGDGKVETTMLPMWEEDP